MHTKNWLEKNVGQYYMTFSRQMLKCGDQMSMGNVSLESPEKLPHKRLGESLCGGDDHNEDFDDPNKLHKRYRLMPPTPPEQTPAPTPAPTPTPALTLTP